MSSSASVHHCTCPQTIAAENHKAKTSRWWADPRWPPLRDAFLGGNKVCAFCGGKATLVHHDKADSYHSQEEYYNPENFTPCCMRCHHAYRTGYIICPVCRQHYMRPGKEMCRACAVLKYPELRGRHQSYRYHAKQRHPCAHRAGQQRCQRDGRCFVCGHSSKKAEACEYFKEREAKV